jgi:hypothetical protein
MATDIFLIDGVSMRFFSIRAMALLFLPAFFQSIPAQALVQAISADPSFIAHGWVAPGGTLNISTRVTANVGGVPPVNIGYALISQTSGAVLTSKTASYTLTQGQPATLSLAIPVPAGAAQGRFRAELRVSNGSIVLWSDPRSACFTISTTQPQSSGFLVPVRGCSELPNVVYTSGSQIVDANGAPLRISSVAWGGTEGRPGWASQGLWKLNYRRVMESFRSAGFNAIRIPWTDAILNARPSKANNFIDAGSLNNAELLDPAFPNPDARGVYTYKKTIDIFQHYADYAAQLGLKIIFEHHSNRGYAGQQQNGLWFSKDTTRNYCSDGEYVQGVDGSASSPSATFGRCSSPDSPPAKYVDYATFRQNWVTLASKFSGHPAVIGFELHNEPANMWSPCGSGAWVWCAPVQINWGVSNDQYDIKWMAEDVGNAIHAVNPNALIILEAPFAGYNGSTTPQYVPRPKPPGTDPAVSAADGDLTAVAAYASKPVTLARPHKLSYSVHMYPHEIVGDRSLPSSANYSASYWMPEFGYLVARNIAPVLVSEIGACIAQGNTSQDALNFLNGAIPFLNGRMGVVWGPTLYANRQPISTSWWLGAVTYLADNTNNCTNQNDRNPNGLWSAWPTGDFVPFSLNRSETLAYTDQLLFKGTGDVSPDNAVVGAGGTVVDASRNVWAVVDGKVTFNGGPDSTTSNAVSIAYAGNRICYRATSGRWSCKAGTSWTAAASPLRASPDGFVSTQGGPLVIDAAGNFWGLGFGRVMINGAPDDATSAGVQIAWYRGAIWYMNTSGAWFSRTATTAWTAAAANPLPASTATKVITEGGGAIIDGRKNIWTIVDGVVVVNGVPDWTTANVIELAYAGGRIWQKNWAWLWRSKVLPTDVWTPLDGQPTRPAIPTSLSQATVAAGGGSIVTPTDWSWDWTISDGKVVVDGVVDETTRDVVQLAYFNNRVWQRNNVGSWWSKSRFFDSWIASPTPPF